jgi:hypothetical protein
MVIGPFSVNGQCDDDPLDRDDDPVQELNRVGAQSPVVWHEEAGRV